MSSQNNQTIGELELEKRPSSNQNNYEDEKISPQVGISESVSQGVKTTNNINNNINNLASNTSSSNKNTTATTRFSREKKALVAMVFSQLALIICWTPYIVILPLVS